MDELQSYLVSYPYQGARWNIEIKARDMNDARARLNQIMCFARIDGEIAVRIPLPAGKLGVIVGRALGAVQGFFLPAR